MNLSELKSVVSLGEGENLEFKRKVNHPEKIIREIVAFANTKGGKLLIGVDDNGRLSGLKFAREDEFALEHAIQQWITPKIDYQLKLIPLNAKKAIISYEIYESKTKPHYVIENEGSIWKRAYVRVADKTIKASKEFREILRKKDKGNGIRFRFGEKEKLLMQYLEEHDHITITAYCQIANLPRWLASRTLVRLVLANVLQIVVTETEDKYKLK